MTLVVGETEDLAACLALRWAVFVEEQGVAAELERDGLDAGAVHLLATRDGVPVGTLRMLEKPFGAKVGRVAVAASERGLGVGRALMRAAEAAARARGWGRLALESQTHAVAFYEALGYEAQGEEFLDAGIPHRSMGKAL